ncbi:hypothetical protein COLO4_19053 [Corchorus olitorius]|uniref:Uncharacterized protein n=1 Tax=Corchorus olitorius TaxID=93759 RepID=A0A1R3J707_9ROSI|nr:hypothetical protein COLO4_19053 [Corchorus olitorius]
MAVDLHNCELLLPSQFFTPQDNSNSNDNSSNKPIKQNASCLLFGSSDSGSDLSSPIGSEVSSSSSTESSEEEEDDYIGELTRQMAQYMLQDEDKHEKPWGLSGSPESNLDSPVGPSREPSPPLTIMTGNFEKMKTNEEPVRYNHAVSRGIQNAEIQTKQALIDDQIRAIQVVPRF